MFVEPVILKKHALRWGKLPVSTKTSLVAGVERVRRLCEEIEQCALVSVMPVVEMMDVCWVRASNGTPEGYIHGRTTVLSRGAAQLFGVQLCAPTVLYADDEALRGILLHEFSHVFNMTRRVLRALAAGETALRLEPPTGIDEDEWDRRMLERPEDWFGPRDVAIFPYWHSRLLDRFTGRIEDEWLRQGLPYEVPDSTFRFTHVPRMSPEIVAHAQELETRGL